MPTSSSSTALAPSASFDLYVRRTPRLGDRPGAALTAPGQLLEVIAAAPDAPPSVAGGGAPTPRPVRRFGAVVGLERAALNERPALPDFDDEARVTVTGAGDRGRVHQLRHEPSPPPRLSRSSSSSDLNRGR